MSTVYTEVFIEHDGDGFRHRFSEVDGIIRIDYQEYVCEDGSLAYDGKKGEWKTKETFEGLWCSELENIITALRRVSEGVE